MKIQMNGEGNHQLTSLQKDLIQTIPSNSDSPCRKMIKALIDSGAAISLMCKSVYNMIENHYKTSIMPKAMQLTTADGSSMSLMGKKTLHLQIANFKFSHTFIICYRLPATDFLFGINIQKWHFSSYCWDSQTFLHTKRRLIPNLQPKQEGPA